MNDSQSISNRILISPRRAGIVTACLAITLLLAACGTAQPSQSGQGTAEAANAPATSVETPQASAGANGRPAFRETPAPELPTTQADVTGLFVRRQGASIFVGTGFGQGFGQGQGNARRTPGANTGTRRPPSGTPVPYNGPTTEVVTNSSTKFYKDVTQMNFQGGQNAGPIQQQVQAVNSLDDLIGADTTNGTMTVWGDKNGDQLVATVVVYRQRQAPPSTATPAG